jgi:hypothetical protein
MKTTGFKIAFVLASIIVLRFIQVTVQPMVIADSAVLQLQDSDTAYQGFKGLQRAFEFYGLLYILPFLIYTKDIKKLGGKK